MARRVEARPLEAPQILVVSLSVDHLASLLEVSSVITAPSSIDDNKGRQMHHQIGIEAEIEDLLGLVTPAHSV